MSRRRLFLIVLASALLLGSCTAGDQSHASRSDQLAKEAEARFTATQGVYFGLASPGTEAELFAAGLLSTEMNDRDIAITPDLKEIVFGVLESPRSVLFSTRQQANGSWSTPQLLPFSGHHDDVEPHFANDGHRLYFCSTRPVNAGDPEKDYDIWFVDRNADGWGLPQNPGPPLNSEENEFYPAVTRDGSVFFTSADMRIMVCPMGEDGLEARQPLPATINSGRAEYNAYVDPDASYIVFTSHGWEGGAAGRGDLFVSFHRDGEWTPARSLGPAVNSETADMSPFVSPDSRFLFFASMRRGPMTDAGPITSYHDVRRQACGPGNGKMDIYWVDAAVLESTSSAAASGDS